MAKKIRFPLEMIDGIEVRTLEELKENFSLEKVLFYLSNGKLITWLRDRYLDDVADTLSELNPDDSNFTKNVCDVFEVEYDEEFESIMEKAAERTRKTALLKEFNCEKSFFSVVDQIAFDQDDLYDLLDENETTVYLCGERFSIPLSKKGIRYIGVNNPTVVISSKEQVDFEEKRIVFENVSFDEKYQKLLGDLNPNKEDTNRDSKNSYAEYGDYSPNSYINFLLSVSDKVSAKNCYEKIRNPLSSLMYDIDADIKDIKKRLLDDGLVGMANGYLKNL